MLIAGLPTISKLTRFTALNHRSATTRWLHFFFLVSSRYQCNGPKSMVLRMYSGSTESDVPVSLFSWDVQNDVSYSNTIGFFIYEVDCRPSYYRYV